MVSEEFDILRSEIHARCSLAACQGTNKIKSWYGMPFLQCYYVVVASIQSTLSADYRMNSPDSGFFLVYS